MAFRVTSVAAWPIASAAMRRSIVAICRPARVRSARIRGVDGGKVGSERRNGNEGRDGGELLARLLRGPGELDAHE